MEGARRGDTRDARPTLNSHRKQSDVSGASRRIGGVSRLQQTFVRAPAAVAGKVQRHVRVTDFSQRLSNFLGQTVGEELRQLSWPDLDARQVTDSRRLKVEG